MADVSQMNFKAGGKMADDEVTNTEGSGSGGKKKKLILIFLTVLFALIAGLLFLVFSGGEEESSPENMIPIDASLQKKQQEVEDSNFLSSPNYSNLMEFVVGLSDRKRFLKVKLYLGFSNPDALEYLAARTPIVKDLIITTIQYKTTEELSKLGGPNRLKIEIMQKINATVFDEEFFENSDLTDRSPVKRVLFDEFILQ